MVSSDEVAEAIAFFDSNGDQTISVKQVGSCLRALGLIPTEAAVEKLSSSFPEDARLGVAELTPMAREVASQPKPADPALLLEHFDDGDGSMQLVQLRSLLENMAEKMSAKEVDVILQGVTLVDGKVTIAELIDHISSI